MTVHTQSLFPKYLRGELAAIGGQEGPSAADQHMHPLCMTCACDVHVVCMPFSDQGVAHAKL